jgi:hypothetical protein
VTNADGKKRCYAGAVSVPSLPATAICPGCQTMVVLPAEPRGADDPLICGTCGVEVPDYRVEEAIARAAEPEYYPEDELPRTVCTPARGCSRASVTPPPTAPSRPPRTSAIARSFSELRTKALRLQGKFTAVHASLRRQAMADDTWRC